jgi:hypothetical protein
MTNYSGVITVRSSTKGQMQIMEMVIVLVIFFFIVGVGIIFYFRFAQNEAVKEQATIDEYNLLETAKAISSLPELHCSQAGDEALYCIDMYKAEAFYQAMRDDRAHYANLFAGYEVELRCIYPDCANQGMQSLQLMDYKPAGTTSKRPLFLPVLIHNPIQRTFSYGELIIWQHT